MKAVIGPIQRTGPLKGLGTRTRRSLREGLTGGARRTRSGGGTGRALELLLGRVGLPRNRSRGGRGLLLVEGLTGVGGLSHEGCSLPSELGTQAGYRVYDAL